MNFFSYSSASWASWILRSMLRLGSVMQRFRISCIVIVEPPWTIFPASTFSDQRPQAALVVDPVVFVEALVLDRDGRVLEVGWGRA